MDTSPDTSHTIYESPLGALTLVAKGEALIGVYFPEHSHMPDPRHFGPQVDSGFEAVVEQLEEYFRGDRVNFELPLAPTGDAFQQRVWNQLRAIPYGETRSYGQLAKELGDPALARAVGAANGRNPISIIVPCHRVVGADGKLVGYAGGLARKRLLLDLESGVAGRRLRLDSLAEGSTSGSRRS